MRDLQKHSNNQQRPCNRRDVDSIAEAAQVEFGSRREHAAAADKHDDDGDDIADLDTDSAARNNGLEGKVAAQYDEAEDQVDG